MGVRGLTRRPFVLTFVALGTIELLRLVVDPRPADLLVLVLVALVGLLAIREREAVADTEGTRRTEAESFARILRALSRSGLARRDRRGHRRGARCGHRRGPRRGRAPPARIPGPRVGPVLDPARRPDVAHLAAAERARGPGRRRRPGGARRRRLGRAAADRHLHRPRPRGRPAARAARHCRRPDGLGGRRHARRVRLGGRPRPGGRAAAVAATIVAPAAAGHLAAGGRRPAHRRPDRDPRRRRVWPQQRPRGAAPGRRPDRGRDRRLSPDERAVARQRAPDPRGGGNGGVGGPDPRLLAARGGGPRLHRRPDRPAELPLLRRVPRPAGEAPPGGGPGRGPDDRHRPVQEAQRHVRACGGRPRAARGRARDRAGGPRGRRPGPLRGRGVRGPVAQPEPRGGGRGRGARPACRLGARPAAAGRAGRERVGRGGGRDDAGRRPSTS